MLTIHRNAELNELLVLLGRSLLQYVGESWPWAGPDEEDVQRAVDALAARQREHEAQIAALLAERDWNIDFGTYPTEFTDLHYVALDYLLAELVAHEGGMTREIEALARRCADDAEAAPLAERVLADHRDEVRQLETLVRAHPQPGANGGTAARAGAGTSPAA
ncbi:MAG TPA: ferritin-like domain-containing protein [Planctomycetaceae bacterium]|nr:ferritin-like domain-containing protein [Planctomycetaceae bacterium]